MKHEKVFCDACIDALPQTNYHRIQDNLAVQLFWGRTAIEHAASLFYINKHNTVHDLIIQLKYANKTDIGFRFGEIAGEKIRQKDSLFRDLDYIIPVPLHWKREKQRGYNQSLLFAKGISEATNIAIDDRTLFRAKENISQTRKNKYERWENVDSIFKLKDKEKFNRKHVLLVDDVITTGATLEACIHALKETKDIRVSIFTIATAERQ